MSNQLKTYRVTPPGVEVQATDTADARRVATNGSRHQPAHVTVEEVEVDLRETVQKTERATPEESPVFTDVKPKKGKNAGKTDK